jgi:hypothetical protein
MGGVVTTPSVVNCMGAYLPSRNLAPDWTLSPAVGPADEDGPSQCFSPTTANPPP